MRHSMPRPRNHAREDDSAAPCRCTLPLHPRAETSEPEENTGSTARLSPIVGRVTLYELRRGLDTPRAFTVPTRSH